MNKYAEELAAVLTNAGNHVDATYIAECELAEDCQNAPTSDVRENTRNTNGWLRWSGRRIQIRTLIRARHRGISGSGSLECRHVVR